MRRDSGPVTGNEGGSHLLLIGAGPRLGAAVARRFVREGFRVTLVARNKAALEVVADGLKDVGSGIETIAADASQLGAFREALAPVFTVAPPDVVVYNAALMAPDNLLDADEEYLAAAYAVDLIGAITAVQLAVPGMKRSGGGTVLFTGGTVADNPMSNYASVSLGKAAIRAAASMLAAQLAGDGIHVASVTISGSIRSDPAFAPDRIADAYWRIHRKPRHEWRGHYRFNGDGGW